MIAMLRQRSRQPGVGMLERAGAFGFGRRLLLASHGELNRQRRQKFGAVHTNGLRR
jgi:hypothetical protein